MKLIFEEKIDKFFWISNNQSFFRLYLSYSINVISNAIVGICIRKSDKEVGKKVTVCSLRQKLKLLQSKEPIFSRHS